MTFENWLEIAGYVGSALVLLSFLMTSVVKLRLVNMAGSLISGIYALIIRSYPLALMNGALVLINLYFLWKMNRTKNNYVFVKTSLEDPIYLHFLNEFKPDIEKCFPGINPRNEVNFAGIILSDDAPAGIIAGFKDGEKLEMHLDYSLPRFRDTSPGKFLIKELPKYGIQLLRYSGPTQNHLKYLEKMNFKLQDDGSYQLRLS